MGTKLTSLYDVQAGFALKTVDLSFLSFFGLSGMVEDGILLRVCCSVVCWFLRFFLGEEDGWIGG